MREGGREGGREEERQRQREHFGNLAIFQMLLDIDDNFTLPCKHVNVHCTCSYASKLDFER